MPTFNDPLLSGQWHFQLLGNINAIWNDYSGAGINIGIYDGGLQYTHPDLNDNYDTSLHFTYNGVTYNPLPISPGPGFGGDGHGTSVAGILASEGGNGLGGVGVAWDATLTGVNILADPRFFGSPFADELALAAFRHAASFDISSNSWGYSYGYDDDGNIVDNPFFAGFLNRADPFSWGSAVVNSFGYAVENGRGGLGTVIVKAAGNDATNANGEGINGSRFVVDVAALSETGQITNYSNYGTNILVSAGAAAVTTDLLGSNGYNTATGSAGDYTNSFDGSSAAAPVVSGVVALMLDANETLGWRDVREILATSAALTGTVVTGDQSFEVSGTYFQTNSRPGDSWNDGGRGYSLDYGFGRVDAYAAVRMAEVWSLFGPAQTSANEETVSVAIGSQQSLNFDGSIGGYQRSITLDVAEDFRIENIDVTVSCYLSPSNTTREIHVTVQAPDGTYFPMIIGEDNLSPAANGDEFSWTFGISHALGLNAAGTWRISVLMPTITAANLTLNVTELELDFYGSAWDFDNVHHITKDYLLAQTRNADGTRDRVINDTNGGADWINMATIAGGVTATLDALGRILVGGTQWATIAAGAVIENIVTGDGADTLTGSSLANNIHGMRGIDVINGLGGNDTLDGGGGNDVVRGGNGRDTVRLGVGNDVFNDEVEAGGAGSDTVFGGDGNDTLNGDGGGDRLFGDAGNDRLFGGLGNDTIFGGFGIDFIDAGIGHDLAHGGDGDDRIIGGEGLDTLFGNVGNDSISGNQGNDSMAGGNGNDTLTGDSGNDALRGDAGNDFLFGGAGLDTLTGGIGNDKLAGDSEADTFVFMSGFGLDEVADFLNDVDTLAFSVDLLAGLADAVAFVDTYANVVGSDVVFDFGIGNALVITGAVSRGFLYDDISFI